MDRGCDFLAVRHQEGVPIHLDVLLSELLGDASAAGVASHEHENVAFLQSPDQIYCFLVGRCGPHDCCEAWHTAVDELYALESQYGVVGKAEPYPICRIRTVNIFQNFDCLFGKQRCRACVQCVAQVGEPQVLGRHGGQQLVGFLHGQFQIAERLNLLAQQHKHNRQEVCSVRILDLAVLALGFNGLGEGFVSTANELVRTANRSTCDDL